jgi:type IV secretory pathway VirJ component
MNVYECIAAVSADLAHDGIAKGRKNAQQGYNFRGVDDMYNALAMPLSRRGLVILPRTLSREVTERATQKGGALFYVVVEVEFDFVSAKDGSKHTVKTYGEAMDSADKATNKAMSAAYKYAVMQAFCIPTEGDNDADATTHVVAARGGPDEVEMESVLSRLREAAMEGSDALQALFRDMPKSEAKAAVWAQHGASLKAAAAKAKVPA